MGQIRETANWFHDTFDEIFRRHTISSVGFKAHYDLKRRKDLYAHGLPVGVLASFCAERDLPIEGFTVQKIKGYKFLDLPKGTQTLSWVDLNHNDTNMYWNNDARYCISVALERARSF